MQRLNLNNTDLSLSRLVYGVWRLADDPNHATSHVRAKIDAALAEGITSFDHADIYGNYECEALFGKALAEDPGLRQRIEIITKCDICMATDKNPDRRVGFYDTSAAYITGQVEQSLKNLHTDVIDTLLLHRPDPLMNAAETGPALDALIDSGKIRSAGVSNFKPDDWRLLQAHMKHKLVINQIEMSVLERQSFTNGELNALQLDGITAMAWSPLAGGRLFGNEDAAQRARQVMQRVADEHNSRLDLVAFAWLLKHPANILPVVGTNNIERIQGLSGALDITMDRHTWFEIFVAAAGQGMP